MGWADAAIARELPDGTLELVDGHLRADLDADAVIPVMVVDLDEGEAKKVLATLDPLAAMAELDADNLGALLQAINSSDNGVRALLDDLNLEVQATLALNSHRRSSDGAWGKETRMGRGTQIGKGETLAMLHSMFGLKCNTENLDDVKSVVQRTSDVHMIGLI